MFCEILGELLMFRAYTLRNSSASVQSYGRVIMFRLDHGN